MEQTQRENARARMFPRNTDLLRREPRRHLPTSNSQMRHYPLRVKFD
ncbi:hypothetical protein LINPERPRIM_LOCUS17509 [Linum perenne]